MSRVAVDTNVLAYAADLRQIDQDDPKRTVAKALIEALLIDQELVVPAQVCLELHHLLIRKGGRSRAAAADAVQVYRQVGTVIWTDDEVIDAAFALAEQHSLQTYDAVILASAARAGCDVLYSEDMQRGFEWNGVRVINPFA